MAPWFEKHFTYCLLVYKFCIEHIVGGCGVIGVHIALHKLNHKEPLIGNENNQFGPNRG
jgi:hypothetical protein